MTLDQVARASGLTKGFLSQLERGLSKASVASLRRICGVLGVPVGSVLDDRPRRPIAVAQAQEISFGGTGAVDRLLTPPGFPGFQVIHATVAPGGHSERSGQAVPESAHFVHVLSGTFELTVQGHDHTLSGGESLAFAAVDDYSWRNPSDSVPVTLLWALTPPEF